MHIFIPATSESIRPCRGLNWGFAVYHGQDGPDMKRCLFSLGLGKAGHECDSGIMTSDEALLLPETCIDVFSSYLLKMMQH